VRRRGDFLALEKRILLDLSLKLGKAETLHFHAETPVSSLGLLGLTPSPH